MKNFVKKIAVLGSAFDPPTLGHKNVVQQCLDNGFDKVYLVPSYKHGHGKPMAEYSHRLNLTTLFVEDIQETQVEVKAVEEMIYQQKGDDTPVYTFDLLAYLEEKKSPNEELVFVIGPDNQKKFDTFYKGSEIKKKWKLFVAEEKENIHSTQVRQTLTKQQDVTLMVTENVARYLEETRLYQSAEKNAL